MTSRTTERFRKAFRGLPENIQRKAKKVYKVWKDDPYRKSLCFKQIHPNEPIYSVRITLGWRAVGVREGEHMVWFWIGSHADYDKLISQI